MIEAVMIRDWHKYQSYKQSEERAKKAQKGVSKGAKTASAIITLGNGKIAK